MRFGNMVDVPFTLLVEGTASSVLSLVLAYCSGPNAMVLHWNVYAFSQKQKCPTFRISNLWISV